jgi:regulator of RNase E activity RraA
MAKMVINQFPELLSEDVLERASKLSSANLCDGMIGMGLIRDGCMSTGIYPVDPSMKTFGTACTVDTEAGNNLPVHVALYISPPGKPYVMVIDGNNEENYPYFGDNMMTTAKVVGLKGMIIDGCVRDREACLQLGLSIFTRGFIPRGPLKLDFGGINRTIKCGGVTVVPGDLVIADADGIAVAPRNLVYRILDVAEKKLRYDNDRKALMAEYEKARLSRNKLPELTPKWVNDIIGEGYN